MNNYIFEIKPFNRRKYTEGRRQLNTYLGLLGGYDSSWRYGTYRDYYFWDPMTGPIIKSGLGGSPLPGGKWAVVFPPVKGVIMYMKFSPKIPRSLVDVVYLKFVADAEFEAEVGTGTLTASTGAGEATVITINAAESAEVSFSLAGMAEAGTATTTIGTVATADVAIGVSSGTATAEMGAP